MVRQHGRHHQTHSSEQTRMTHPCLNPGPQVLVGVIPDSPWCSAYRGPTRHQRCVRRAWSCSLRRRRPQPSRPDSPTFTMPTPPSVSVARQHLDTIPQPFEPNEDTPRDGRPMRPSTLVICARAQAYRSRWWSRAIVGESVRRAGRGGEAFVVLKRRRAPLRRHGWPRGKLHHHDRACT
jgi:hypothetical protein